MDKQWIMVILRIVRGGHNICVNPEVTPRGQWISLITYKDLVFSIKYPVDNFGTVVGENPNTYGILALWTVNGLSIVYWV